MGNLYSQIAFDADLELKAAGLVASTTTESTIVDLGAGLVDGFLVLDVSAIETATGDEKYTMHVGRLHR